MCSSDLKIPGFDDRAEALGLKDMPSSSDKTARVIGSDVGE